MSIGIIGYDLFGTGGTSRSNINLINEFLEIGETVTYFNLLPFSKKKIKKIEEEILDRKSINFSTVDKFRESDSCDTYIITRESLFLFSKVIKLSFPDSKVIGEVHAPLDLIEPEVDLCPDSIDVYRVATESIKEEFCKRIKGDNVVVFPVSARHIKKFNMTYQNNENRKNFLIYSRFDERQKDIAYAIKLMEYYVNKLKKKNYFLYINGNGSGEILYRKLIELYSLQSYVFINQEKPNAYIYLSTARYETFGYSIMEAFSEGKQIILYHGDDQSLSDIYQGFKSICWINKNIFSDSQEIDRFLSCSFSESQKKYAADVEHARETLTLRDYGRQYILTVINSKYKKEYTSSVSQELIYNKLMENNNLKKERLILNVYLRMKELPFIGKVVSSNYIKNSIKKALSLFKKKKLSTDRLLEGKLWNNFIFVESFHGKSFSGDPKYLALALKKENPEMIIYVSSINELVDMEILDNGCIPLRLGGNQYIEKFRKSKLVILNGNSLDKVGKVKGQIFLQTWHGFPLKKMVFDLENQEQQKIESQAFLPRMLKWDYLLSSSSRNTELFYSAFMLEKNDYLQIIEKGAPRNSYLINNKNNKNEKIRIIQKYFNQPFGGEKKYILYCPTWRKNKRKKVSALDLKKVVQGLPSDYEIIVKLHPLESKLFDTYRNIDSRVHCFPNELTDIQELFLISDVLITDYSSAMFDYAHLKKKTIVLQEDKTDYQKLIGWYFDLAAETGLTGRNLTEKELADEIMQPSKTEYNTIIEKKYLNRDSSETIKEIAKSLSLN
ncbi:CDP-glycerol glycerophosphotransferase family protein [Enterococcus massiliensis]|uniref:CDP-glycerol glycerophosphotransferase family protein n=1 Tax=Enterococcus massiliensis TaxID=1640685 RepID=UPI00065E6054|nr:CDP-glycerol glycerophosphotransferase family protein [Enterococcus massiliensis]